MPCPAMIIFLFKIGFLPVTVWDLLDIIIVGYLIYRLYNLLKGTIALNILIGVVFVYAIGWLTKALNMVIMSAIINHVANIGVLALIIIFQPEIRRFLLYLGQTTLHGRMDFLKRFLQPELDEKNKAHERQIRAITSAAFKMGARHIGALIVIANKNNVSELARTGKIINALISEELLLSIFSKDSPLHDGAVLIHKYRIYATGCVLPLSNRHDLPQKYGLRHRSGIGLSEASNMAVIIVSEETGSITWTQGGRFHEVTSRNELINLLRSVY